ncbi:MAG: hypothetical protein GAK33_00248 [Burkholderia lata]|uniref:Uncharacterized protein n=1 Tax=Burkholderia lata (strain ATCC 17760 / DSM 23089 / LMG 22485 / NCIMB 9086 / R18194 / 383) TaxID=482957 RepID=A0A833V4L3_BURL3|nr:hypothetical protein [Burkholderia lata]KAF1040631.1 MAG: hypothetical protein GAK33_00248 [Burkholderia lata]
MTHSQADEKQTGNPAVTWNNGIKQLFTKMDVTCMQAKVDLTNYSSVVTYASRIYDRVTSTIPNRVMPPGDSGENHWTDDMTSKFKAWMDSGCPEG